MNVASAWLLSSRVTLPLPSKARALVFHAQIVAILIPRRCAFCSAFDGSGSVTRDDNKHALATFTTGKQYNCDLSASYNIGARYFIRELLKSLPATEESRVKAKVPDAGRRTSCTLSTLRALVKELSAA